MSVVENLYAQEPYCFPPYQNISYCCREGENFGLKWQNSTLGDQLISTDGLVILRKLNGFKCKSGICGLPMVRLRRGLGTFCLRKKYNKKKEALLIASGICHAVNMDVSRIDPIKIINTNEYLAHINPLYSFGSDLSRIFLRKFKVRNIERAKER